MDKQTLTIIKAAGDILTKRIISENAGDTEAWGCLFQTLNPEMLDDDYQPQRVAEWQHHKSIHLIRETLDQVKGTLKFPGLAATYVDQDIDRMKDSMGTVDKTRMDPDDPNEIPYVYMEFERYAYIRDLITIRVIEKLAEARRSENV